MLPPSLGRVATAVAAALGPAVTTYTAALISDTAVPAWHDGYRELPFLFAGSSATAAGGLALALSPLEQMIPARRLAVLGATLELAGAKRLECRLGMVAEPYQSGRAGRLLRAGQLFTGAGLALAVAGRSKWLRIRAGLALVAASAATRFGIFEAGRQSAEDPKYTVEPQQARVRRHALSGA